MYKSSGSTDPGFSNKEEVSKAPRAGSGCRKPHWVAYEDDGWYWLESSQEPFFSIAVLEKTDFERLLKQAQEQFQVTEPTRLYVKDPVHQYVQVPAPIAYAMQSEYVQRLRGLRQNGVGYLVFPSLQASRFEHSLGAMWLATRVCHHLFQGTTDPPVLRNFSEAVLRDFRDWIRLTGLLLVQSSDIGAVVELTHEEEGLISSLRLAEIQMTLARPDHLPIKGARVFTTQVLAKHFVKLTVAHYALLHDIGHLPFSHTLEAPLETVLYGDGGAPELYFPDTFVQAPRKENGAANPDNGNRPLARWKVPLHERLSLAIIQGHMRYASDVWRRAVMLTHVAGENFAWKDRKSPSGSVYHAIHSVVSGDIDVDRLDFIARDGYESGAAFGHFDLDRVVRAAVVQEERTDTGETTRFLVTFEGHALRDIESVLLERAKLYNTIAFHHKVRFFDATLALCLVKAWARGTNAFEELKKHFWPPCSHSDVTEVDPCDMTDVCFAQLKDDSQGLRHLDPTFLVRAECGVYGYFDDSAVLRMLHQLGRKDMKAAEADYGLIRAAARTIVFREPRGYSLYKRPDDLLPIRDKAFRRVADHLNKCRAKGKARGSMEYLSDRDIQKVLIGLMSERMASWDLRRLKDLFQESFPKVMDELAKDDRYRSTVNHLAEKAKNCEAYISETGRTFGPDFPALKVRMSDKLYMPVTCLSGVLGRLADMPNEIGYYIYFLWTGELWHEAPWRLWSKKHDEWKGWLGVLQEAVYSSLERAFEGWLNEKPDRWQRLWELRRRKARS